VVSRKADACRSVADEITRDTGQQAVGIACNVSNWSACTQLVEDVYEQFGRVDVLVNNAGMSPLYPSLADISEELYDKVLAVNLKGPFRLAALVGTRMAEQGGGSIINVSSIGAVWPSAGEVPYAAAKAGLNVLAGGMSRAFGPSVRVNTIMPGMFLTDISKSWNAEFVQEIADRDIPLKRAGEPTEIIGTALYLASSASSYTTGASIAVDGGTSSSRGAVAT
jgi:NAD(P)-dependent dehydrogenase (short-subunit alcohol dehydrogenase family)